MRNAATQRTRHYLHLKNHHPHTTDLLRCNDKRCFNFKNPIVNNVLRQLNARNACLQWIIGFFSFIFLIFSSIFYKIFLSEIENKIRTDLKRIEKFCLNIVSTPYSAIVINFLLRFKRAVLTFIDHPKILSVFEINKIATIIYQSSKEYIHVLLSLSVDKHFVGNFWWISFCVEQLQLQTLHCADGSNTNTDTISLAIHLFSSFHVFHYIK